MIIKWVLSSLICSKLRLLYLSMEIKQTKKLFLMPRTFCTNLLTDCASKRCCWVNEKNGKARRELASASRLMSDAELGWCKLSSPQGNFQWFPVKLSQHHFQDSCSPQNSATTIHPTKITTLKLIFKYYHTCLYQSSHLPVHPHSQHTSHAHTPKYHTHKRIR